MKESYFTGSIDNKSIIIKEAIAKYDNLDKPENRYSLTITLDNNGKETLTVIMFNPSEKAITERSCSKNNPIDLTENGKKKTFVDGTITNVIRIANKCNYSKIIVLNLFSGIDSKPTEILKYPKKFINKDNETIISEVIKNNNDILIAWGSCTKSEIIEKKKKFCLEAKGKFKCFSWNEKSATPTHPSPYNNCKVQKFLNNKEKLESIDVKKIMEKLI